jgi:hypothetical protein
MKTHMLKYTSANVWVWIWHEYIGDAHVDLFIKLLLTWEPT